MSKKEIQAANAELMTALEEWKNAGAPVIDVTLALHEFIAEIIKYSVGPIERETELNRLAWVALNNGRQAPQSSEVS